MKNIDRLMYLLGRQQALNEMDEFLKKNRESTDFINIDENVIQESDSTTIIYRKRPFKWVAGIAAILAVCVGLISVLSYIDVMNKNNTKEKVVENNENDGDDRQEINYDFAFKKFYTIYDRMGLSVHLDPAGELKTIVKGNHKFTVTNYELGGSCLYVLFDIETLDKSPLCISEENIISLIGYQCFGEAYMEFNGIRYKPECLYRYDDGSIPYKATFEAEFSGYSDGAYSRYKIPLTDIDGAKVKFVFKNLKDYRRKSDSIGFKFDSLADVYEQLPGKVYFSSVYPDAYIEKMEFNEYIKADNSSIIACYITIYPGSEEAKKRMISKIVFQDLTTGNLEWPASLSMIPGGKGNIIDHGDRFTIALSTYTFVNQKNITKEDLSNFIIKFDDGCETPTICAKEWIMELKLNQREILTFDGEKEIILPSGKKIIFHDFKLSSTDLIYKATREGDMSSFDFFILLNGGKEIDISRETVGGSWYSYGWQQENLIQYKKAIDIKEVTGVRIGETVITFG